MIARGADVLFRRRAEHQQRDRVRRDGALEAERAAEAGGGDQVMSAGVADLRQRVVLAQVSDRDGPFAPARAKGGVEAEGGALNGKAPRLQAVGEQCAGARLLHRELGMRVDVEGDVDQVIAGGGDGGAG